MREIGVRIQDSSVNKTFNKISKFGKNTDIIPVFFYNHCGELYCFIHGRKDGTFKGGLDADTIYKTALLMSDMEFGKTLHVITCFSNLNTMEYHPFIKFEVKCDYPITIVQKNNWIYLTIPEDQEESDFCDMMIATYNYLNNSL